MTRILVTLLWAVALALGWMPGARAMAEPVTLRASDGVPVSATLFGEAPRGRPVILLFHQAGGSAAEYDAIAPRLASRGFDVLAVDQRSGGAGFGRANRTVETLGRSAAFLDALPDLRAAVEWAAARNPPAIIAWGSSYSASLVFLLAAEDRRVSAVMAFSPGEYFSDHALVRHAASRVTQPVLASSASSPDEIAGAAAILAALPGTAHVQVKPRHAAHGSIALASPDASETWSAVERFLEPFRPSH